MDDLISRKAAIEGLLAFCPERTEPGSLDEYGATVLYAAIDVVVKQLPAVDAVPVEWLNNVILTGDAEESQAAWKMLHNWNDEHFADIGKMQNL